MDAPSSVGGKDWGLITKPFTNVPHLLASTSYAQDRRSGVQHECRDVLIELTHVNLCHAFDLCFAIGGHQGNSLCARGYAVFVAHDIIIADQVVAVPNVY